MKQHPDLSNQAAMNETARLSPQKPSEPSGAVGRETQGIAVQEADYGDLRALAERHINRQEAEAMFQFGDFLCGLASELFSRDQKEKCHLCAYAVTAKCSHPFRPCYTGIRTYLFQRAAVYREEMDRCNRAYFAYLDSIHDKEGMNSYMAEEALKTEYPWLSDHPEYAKCAIALWMLNHLE